jgi:5-methylcytosine-specific restriction endonuclease McrA
MIFPKHFLLLSVFAGFAERASVNLILAPCGGHVPRVPRSRRSTGASPNAPARPSRLGAGCKLKRPHIPLRFRLEIWRMPCAVCHSRKNVYIDHIVPVLHGGTNERSNLQPLCRRCNSTKGSKLITNAELRQLCWWLA